jgi:serine/threonine-protein kinase
VSQEDLVLSNRYRLARQLATGGMGEVWEATDELLIRPVAVKLLRREYISDEAARTRFRGEARFAAALQHGGIAQVYDYGEQDDLAYLVMELVPGEPLSKILLRSRMLSAEATLDLVSQAARALQVAHAAGIIHRDIKPGNLMVTGDGTVKITDFGIARNGQASELTQAGMVMGTAHYVSPEQASGKDITPATDLYSLGVVAYECLAGRPPFDADSTVAIALKHVREPPPELPPGVPAPVRELVRQLLAKNPARRPGGAQEVSDRAYMIRESLTLGTALAEFEEQRLAPDATQSAAAVDGYLGPETAIDGPIDGPIDGWAGAADAEPGGDGNQRRNVMLLTSVAVALLVLGGIVMGSLLTGGRDGNLMDGKGGQPASTPTAPGNDQARQPTVSPTGTTQPARPVLPSPSEAESSSVPTVSPTTRPTRKPTGTTSPRPSPTVTESPPSPTPTPTETPPDTNAG